jgi:polysaccharide biosynthesis protein PslH
MRILWLQNRILFPANTGGRIRTLNILRYLAKWHDVTYLCNMPAADQLHAEEMRALGLDLQTCPWEGTVPGQWRFYRDLAWNCFSPIPFTAAKDRNPLLRIRAKQLVADRPYDLVICDFLQMAPSAISLGAKASALFQHNVEAQIFHRHATTDRGWLRRRVMAQQWRKMRRFEKEMGAHFDAVIAVSEQDKQTFETEYRWSNVQVIDTAVNIDEYFKPDGHPEQDGRVAFVAAMDWLPNQDGAQHFARKIWPLIRQHHPHATFQIVGRNPPHMIRSLREVSGVEVVGTVPDIRPFLAQASVVVVPLLVGGGTRLKIFEAMAMGKPVVSTTLGAEGLKVTSGEHILLADTPDEFAGAVNSLISCPNKRHQIGQSARALVCRSFSAETVARQFEQICEETVAHREKKNSVSIQ